jgi:hypothetical protein
MLAKLLAPLAVLVMDDVRRKHHPIWGVEDATDLSYWNIAIRNAAHNCFLQDQVEFITITGSPDVTLEKLDGFQSRKRISTSKDRADGRYRSYRCTWGKPRPKKGKREFYIGWTMNELPKMRPVIQFRPF